MPSAKKSSSKPEAAPSPSPSVLDFLYHDSRRVGSFLSQFDPGFLQSLTRTAEASKVDTERVGRGVAVGAPSVLGGNRASGEDVAVGTRNTLQQIYDPYWANARALLNYLEQHGLLQRDLQTSALGQFVLAKGYLTVLDLAMWQKAWGLPTVQQAARAGGEAATAAAVAILVPEDTGNRHERRNQSRQAKGQAQKSQMPTEVDITLELLTVLPHTVHASIMTDEETVWSSLLQENLVTPSSELVLTHGASLPGEWTMVGILSGQPDFGAIEHQQRMAEIGGTLPPGVMNSAIGILAQQMTPMIRQALGRPMGNYAVTPILIFREVT